MLRGRGGGVAGGGDGCLLDDELPLPPVFAADSSDDVLGYVRFTSRRLSE